MDKSEFDRIIQEEFQREKKRRNLLKRLNEIDQQLSEIEPGVYSNSNIPTGYKDPADEDLAPEAEIIDYTISDDKGEVDIFFKNSYNPLNIDSDSLITYVEKKYGIKFKSDHVEPIIDKMVEDKMIEKYLNDYIEDHFNELEPKGA